MSKLVSVIVVGGSHAGLAVSQKLLRQTRRVKVTLINPSDEYYFNISAPRFLVKPESLPQSKYLYSIPDAFRDYPGDRFNFVKGLVTKIDYATKSVSVALDANSSATTTTPTPTATSFRFDYLVIASGSTTPATLGQSGVRLPFKTTAFEDTRKAIHQAQETLSAAKTILIGGAGPLGVELAGELAEVAGPKTITLVSRSSELLEGATAPVQRKALLLLRQRNVDVLTGASVLAAVHEAHTQTWKVKLSTGRTYTVDAYVATTGTTPNNTFIPKSFLNAQGWVNVDSQLRVLEDGISRSDTYALGDITCHPYRLLSRVPLQGETVAANIVEAIEKRGQVRTYSPEAQKKMMVVPVGQSTGAGHVGGWTLFGCLVWYFKGRDFLTYKAYSFLRGEER
ncbi:NAD(P)/FAD-dependent oxidoreductase [Aspergillus lucknowensis]|uniref:FAD/NAD(P)-binding domain-containing protein n=1 Tax=Aspergillus lucknowensis TaxID=176173 RepID=A0ABR4LST9_9EURO